MPGSVVRSVTVNFRAGGVGKYVADVETMGAATRGAFDGTSRSAKDATQSLDGFDRTAKRTASDTEQLARSTRKASQEADNSGRAFRKQASEADKAKQSTGLLRDAIITLGPAAVPIGASVIPLVSGLSAGFIAAAGAAGVLILATHGMSDAMKAMDAYQLQPTTANLAKLNVAMANLGPSGRQFVNYLDDLQPKLHQLQILSEAGVLPGAEAGIEHMLTLLPQVRDIVGSFSVQVGKELESAGSNLSTGSEFAGFLRWLKTDGAPTMHDFAAATGDVIAGLTQLFVDMAPANRSFTQGLLDDAEAFRRWADNVGQTQGFRDFLSYIQTEGPRVMQLLGALGEALLGILKSAAPIGSVVLPILTDLLKVIAAIANTPFGSTIYTGVIAVLAFNRAGQLMDGLLKKLGADTAALSGEMKGLAASTTAVGDASAAAGGAASANGIKGLLSDLGAASSAAALTRGAQAGTASAAEAAAAQARVRAIFGASAAVGFANRGALLGEALPAGAALAIPGLTDKLGNLVRPNPKVLSASPVDLTKFGKDVNTAYRGFQLSDIVGSTIGQVPLIGNGADLRKQPRADLRSEDLGLAQLVANGQGDLAAKQYDAIKASALQAGASVNDVQKAFVNYRAAAAAAGVSTSQVVNAQHDSAQAALQQAAALKTATDAALSSFDAETNYRKALVAAAAQANKNNAGINGATQQALANRDALGNLAAAWNNQSDAVKANGKRYAEAKQSFIDLATGMGVPISQAKHLAATLLEVPKSVQSQITVDTASALAGIQALQGYLNGIPRNVHVNVTASTNANLADISGINAKHQAHADGGTVTGQRHPYGDKVLAYLAPGEEVITNKNGQADRFRADRAAGRIPAYAGGGTVTPTNQQTHLVISPGDTVTIAPGPAPTTAHTRGRGRSRGSRRGSSRNANNAQKYATAADLYSRAEKALHKVTPEVNKLKIALDGPDGNGGLKKALQDAQSKSDALSSAVQSNLQRNLFSGSSSTGFGTAFAPGSPGYAISQLQAEKQDETDYAGLIHQVMDKGITGDALSAILADGGMTALRAFAAADAGTDQQFAALYGQVRGPGGTLAAATSTALAATGDTAQLVALNAKVAALTTQLAKAQKDQATLTKIANQEKTKLMSLAPQQQAAATKAAIDHASKTAARHTKRGPKRG